MVFDAVVVPTLACFRKEWKATLHAQRVKKSAQVKPKKQVCHGPTVLLTTYMVSKVTLSRLNDDTFDSRTKNIVDYDVPLDVFTRDVLVTRPFMSKEYGGSALSTFPKISEGVIFLVPYFMRPI